MSDSGTVEFGWIDVACIDQDDYAVKMDEIGRQAGIFANAHHVYAWLWTLDHDLLVPSVLNIMTDWKRLPFPYVENVSTEFLPIFADVEASLHAVLRDPWFSSLWTLQEGILRQDAVIMSADGRTIFRDLTADEAGRPESRNLEIRDIASASNSIYTALRPPLSGDVLSPSLDENVQARVKAVVDRILRTGYGLSLPYGNSNPNVQFSAARYRTASYEVDRIYGIVALYGIHVGASVPGADPLHSYTLAELEDEFTAALNMETPLLGQMFVHTQEPEPGRSWRIGSSSRVPLLLLNYGDLQYCEDCAVAISADGTAQIRGRITPLEDVFAYWKFWQPSWSIPDSDYQWSMVSFELDDHVLNREEGVRKAYGSDSFMHFDIVANTSESLLNGEAYPGGLSVIQLGIQVEEDPQFSSLYGLVVQHDSENWASCRRLGVCISWRDWNVVESSLGKTDEPKVRCTVYEGTLR